MNVELEAKITFNLILIFALGCLLGTVIGSYSGAFILALGIVYTIKLIVKALEEQSEWSPTITDFTSFQLDHRKKLLTGRKL